MQFPKTTNTESELTVATAYSFLALLGKGSRLALMGNIVPLLHNVL